MTTPLRIALGQMTSAGTHDANVAAMRDLAARAKAAGADMLCLPEVAGLMQRDGEKARAQVVEAARDPFIAACREAAAEHALWLQPGSTPVLGPDGRFLNHATMIGPDGALVAEYDKIHLFDVAIEGEKPIGESRRFAPGERGVVVDTPWGAMGMTICYDLRFPQLFRAEAQAGARLILVPSAFTVPTGRAHWEVLLRARAIENGAWIVAAAQAGTHEDGRETWGHSLVVSPWGRVVCDMGDAAGLELVEIDLAEADKAREQIPSLSNDRPFTIDRAPR
ncbi:carbon-nitrogen hydrolase family protein [Citreimonas salinaria]|uniref:Predicted amidohydrolase n=1 Tax=Citreimonas salinaria TaxID=321339 RepID=A0A1H3H4T0_9RHOB|nr:carbon-nitrogen hydrolase family protein [Citreimonas salinaria]SDY10471.1 Predicted amidohydrolase [Citreimonas salinaria]